jgi:hypothetical protein
MPAATSGDTIVPIDPSMDEAVAIEGHSRAASNARPGPAWGRVWHPVDASVTPQETRASRHTQRLIGGREARFWRSPTGAALSQSKHLSGDLVGDKRSMQLYQHSITRTQRGSATYADRGTAGRQIAISDLMANKGWAETRCLGIPISAYHGHLARSLQSADSEAKAPLPAWIKPQLTRLITEAPSTDECAHDLKFDGDRMHARLDRGDVQALTRTGLNWTDKYPAIAVCGSR